MLVPKEFPTKELGNRNSLPLYCTGYTYVSAPLTISIKMRK